MGCRILSRLEACWDPRGGKWRMEVFSGKAEARSRSPWMVRALSGRDGGQALMKLTLDICHPGSGSLKWWDFKLVGVKVRTERTPRGTVQTRKQARVGKTMSEHHGKPVADLNLGPDAHGSRAAHIPPLSGCFSHSGPQHAYLYSGNKST